MTFLRGIFREGPGWPWTPWYVALMGLGFGLMRSHKALLRQAREADLQKRPLLGVFQPKDIEALAALLSGYVILGLMGFLVFRAFSGLLPGAGRMMAFAGAIYALQGARYLLAFASEERGARGRGFVAWLKANALQTTIVVLLLAGYAIFRDQLARSLPFFALIEFGLGVAVFAFVLARLRGRMKRDGALLATASEARDHERVVSELREPDYDTVARPVARFLETGAGQGEYADSLAKTITDEERAAAIRARLAQHREPPRPPAVEKEWLYASGAAMTIGIAIAAFTLGFAVFEADMPYPFYLALLFVGFGTYAQQDVARAHFEPWTATGIAAIGTSILLFDFLLFAGTIASLAEVPGFVWGIVAAIAAVMVGIPALSSWRQTKRMQAGQEVDARKVPPLVEVQMELQRTRARAATMMLVAFVILLPLPALVRWLASRSVVPPEFPPFLDDILAVAIWVIAAFGASALLRFYGLTRGRPRVVAREKAKRDRRLAIHKELMRTLDRS